jgi:amino acid permease
MPKSKLFFRSVFLQISGIVGSGIFALPYLFSNSHFYISSLALLSAFIVTAIINHFYVDIILATDGDHQLSGYAQKYFGPKLKFFSLLVIILLAFGAIFTYEKLFINFFQIFFPGFSIPIIFTIFFILSAVTHLSHLKFLKQISEFIPIIVLFIPAVLLFYCLFLPSVPVVPIIAKNNFGFIIFGALLFSLSGFTVIPEMEELLRHHSHKNRLLPLSSLVGLSLSVLFYLIFSYSVIRISGNQLTPDSVTGIFNTVPLLGKLIAFLGLIITFKATQSFLLILRELFYRDFHLNKKISDFLPLIFIILPLFLFSLSFLKVISFTGSITIFLSAVIICLIRHRLPHNSLVNILIIFEILFLFACLLLEFL